MSKHTPGPWRADDNDDGTHCITAGRGCDVADTRASVDEQANVALIIAAPELLRASTAAWHLCQSWLALPGGPTAELVGEVERALRVAIRQAEGERP